MGSGFVLSCESTIDLPYSYCEARGIPFYAGSGNVRASARESGQSIEEAARTMRHAFLRQTAGDIFQHLRLRSDGITGEEVKPASYRGLAYCLIALYCYFLAHCAPHLKTLMALSGHIIPHSLQPMHLSGSA